MMCMVWYLSEPCLYIICILYTTLHLPYITSVSVCWGLWWVWRCSTMKPRRLLNQLNPACISSVYWVNPNPNPFTLHYVCVSVCLSRALVGMMMFNNETKEIAKPTELLNSIKAIMNVLQSIENYGITDTTHLHITSLTWPTYILHQSYHERPAEHWKLRYYRPTYILDLLTRPSYILHQG